MQAKLTRKGISRRLAAWSHGCALAIELMNKPASRKSGIVRQWLAAQSN